MLYVRDLERSAAFYRDAFGFEEVTRMGPMSLMRAAGSQNQHDLGLMQVGADAPSPPRGSTGLYHLAWQVGSIEELAHAREVLAELEALGGQSDHGATKSLYGSDPDGNEFEVMYQLPREQWGEYENTAIVAPLRLEEEVARHGTRA
ncbi:MAG: VOC family protein [Dehalococcoidia bacterium]|nr:VOC family protein [Dehalococcoidia bacterium]